MNLILASQSQGRKKLLDYLNIPFEIIPSKLDEEKIIGKSPVETLRLRARLKGEEVTNQLLSPPKQPRSPNQFQKQKLSLTIKQFNNLAMEYLILSADSGAIINDELIGKPKDYDNAVNILKKLSGKTHQYVTCTYIIKLSTNKSKGKEIILDDTDISYVNFRKLEAEDITLYLRLTDYQRFAASYVLISAQNFITKIEGSISSVIGLPLEKLIPILRNYNFLRQPKKPK